MKILLSLIFISLSFNVFSQNQKLIPRSEYDQDSSLNAFVIKLKEAIKQKDKNYILSILDKGIKISFGGEDGIDEFINYWNIDSKNTKLWSILDKILNLGGVYTHDQDSKYQFVFPYVFELDLENGDDYFSVSVVTTNNLVVKEKPDNQSKTIGELSYDVVWIEYSDSFKTEFEAKGWTYMRTLDNRILGYVESEYLYSPIDYRMFLSNIDNSWKITCLIAGD
jgi:hypothetical protein